MLDFTFKPEITKEYLLTWYSDETYFEYYLGIKISKKLFRSRIREDKHPTCSFYRNQRGELIYKDFGDGSNLTFIGLVMKMFNISYRQAINKIAKDFHLLDGEMKLTPVKRKKNVIEQEEPTKIQITEKKFSQEELNWWKSFGITPDILQKYNVHSCRHVFINDELRVSFTKHNYIFGYYFGKADDGRELWKIYMPLRKEYRWKNNLSSKVIQGYNMLPETGKVLVITKSLKDIMVFSKLSIPAIAPNSESQFIPKETMKELKKRFNRIIVFYDNDLTGLSRMREIRKEYPDFEYIWIPRKYKVKDASDFVQAYSLHEFIQLIRTYTIWLKKKYNCNEKVE
jgi:hypothetical protein